MVLYSPKQKKGGTSRWIRSRNLGGGQPTTPFTPPKTIPYNRKLFLSRMKTKNFDGRNFKTVIIRCSEF